jgi:hypothetical protein
MWSAAGFLMSRGCRVFTVHVTRMDRKPIEYMGKNCMNNFIEVIKGLEKEIVAKVESNCPMNPLTN